MKYVLKPLELIAAQLTHLPVHDEENFLKLLPLLEHKTSGIEPMILKALLMQQDPVLCTNYFNLHMRKLVTMCDSLFVKETLMDKPAQASMALLTMLDSLRKAKPELMNRSIPLPKMFQAMQAPRFFVQWDDLCARWKGIPIDAAVLSLAQLPFLQFASHRQKLSWFHFIWIKKYLVALEDLDLITCANPDAALINVLAGMDFNHSLLKTHYRSILQANLTLHADRQSQLYVLNRDKKAIHQWPVLSLEPFYADTDGIKTDLTEWINVEIDFRSNFDVESFEIDGKVVIINEHKFVSHLSAEQLAFWMKTQMDHNIFVEDTVQSFAHKIAYNYATRRKGDLSPHSVLAKLYCKDPMVIKPLYEIAVAMTADLKRFIV